jgi:hypothetical protein
MSPFRRSTKVTDRQIEEVGSEPRQLAKPLPTRDPRILIAASLLHEIDAERNRGRAAHDVPTWIEFLTVTEDQPCSE